MNIGAGFINRCLLLLAAGLFLSACNVSGNITDMTERSTTVVVGQLTGIVSGAKVQTTSGGYLVYSTVGDAVNGVVQTTGSGYTVFSNLSGNYASSSIVTTVQ